MTFSDYSMIVFTLNAVIDAALTNQMNLGQANCKVFRNHTIRLPHSMLAG